MASSEFFFAVYDATTGAPKTGYAASLSFATYKDETGANLAQPTISEVGGGLYKFTPAFTTGHVVGFIVNTSGANPTYLFGYLRPEDYGAGGPSAQTILFAVYDSTTGAPKTGATCTFSTYDDDAGNPLSQPSITEVGGGIYKFNPTFATDVNIAYVISTGQTPARQSGFIRAADFLISGFVPASATALANQVTVAFAAGYVLDVPSGAATTPANWLISGPTAVTVTAINKVGNTIVLTTTDQQAGGAYTLTIPTGLTADGGTKTLISNTISFVGVAGDPAVLQAVSVDERTVDVLFASAPDSTRALDLTQYSITPALTLLSVVALSSTVYRLTTSAQTIGTSYTLTWPLH